MSYRKEIFDLAIHALAGLGTIQERLTDAFNQHLALLKPEELPLSAQDKFNTLHRALTKEKLDLLDDAASVKETLRLMPDQEVLFFIEEIFRIYDFVLENENSDLE
jgi:hypothetical protein